LRMDAKRAPPIIIIISVAPPIDFFLWTRVVRISFFLRTPALLETCLHWVLTQICASATTYPRSNLSLHDPMLLGSGWMRWAGWVLAAGDKRRNWISLNPGCRLLPQVSQGFPRDGQSACDHPSKTVKQLSRNTHLDGVKIVRTRRTTTNGQKEFGLVERFQVLNCGRNFFFFFFCFWFEIKHTQKER
jgi:hypothetical protein